MRALPPLRGPRQTEASPVEPTCVAPASGRDTPGPCAQEHAQWGGPARGGADARGARLGRRRRWRREALVGADPREGSLELAETRAYQLPGECL